jgi:MFS superfamily sulfate permease-like transporter
MLLATNLDAASVLILFGAMQVLTGVIYRLPMPVQPLKAIAAIVIAQNISAEVIYGAGLAIGIVVMLLAVAGLLDWLGNVVPKCVVRGVQVGLGLQLTSVAMQQFVFSSPPTSLLLGAVGAAIALALLGNRRLPAGLVLICIGIAIGGWALWEAGKSVPIRLALPEARVPTLSDVLTGFLILSLPQLPLSLANSMLATRQLVSDLFPERKVSLKRIGITYAAMNLISPFFGGIPVCHGSGGMAGHYTFGGRTGGSVVIYGGAFLVLGLMFSDGFALMAEHFPKALLGVLLFFEGVALILLIRDVAAESPRRDLPIAVIVALLASGIPQYGYLVGVGFGVVLYYAARAGWRGWDRGGD